MVLRLKSVLTTRVFIHDALYAVKKCRSILLKKSKAILISTYTGPGEFAARSVLISSTNRRGMSNQIKGVDMMEGSEKRIKFIEMRAEGLPYRAISKELNISRGTCGQWNAELKKEIAELKRDKLSELFNSYFMMKEARIKQLGETLKKINKALEDKDLNEIPAEKLLDFKVKYISELKDEYIDLDADKSMQEMDTNSILKEFSSLLERVRDGNITQAQANKEISILGSMLKAYESNTLEKKLDELKALFKK